MIKKILLLSLLVPATLYAQPTMTSGSAGSLSWDVQRQWQIPAKPLSLVQSLDNKYVFILGNDAKVYVFTPEGKKLGAMPVDAGVKSIDIAPRGELLYLLDEENNTYTALSISFLQKIDISQAPFMGKADAPVTLVEFSDFECPYCSQVKPLLDQLMKDNPDSLKIVFKHLPLRMHPQAKPAALASIAAQKQGKFWEMHNELFATKKISAETIKKSAEKIGLDMTRFEKDMASPEATAQLGHDIAGAQEAGVSGTPSLFINGRPVKNRSVEGIQQMIEKELAAAGK